METSLRVNNVQPVKKRKSMRYNSKYMYILLLPAVLYIFVFKYIPIYGIILAFKSFNFSQGIFGSPWVGLKYFNLIIHSPSILEVLRNTLVISGLRLVIGFPIPIILALLLNEISHQKFKKFVQTVSYLPFFISWVILGGIIMDLLSPNHGIVNEIIKMNGAKPITFMTDPSWWLVVIISSGIWQSLGYSAIMYLATISTVEQEQYEAAIIDGANRFQRVVHVTMPVLMPIIALMFVFSMSSILNAGFDQVYNMSNEMVMKVSDIVDTYVYRKGIKESAISYGTAVGLFKNVIGFMLLLGANYFQKKTTGYSMFD